MKNTRIVKIKTWDEMEEQIPENRIIVIEDHGKFNLKWVKNGYYLDEGVFKEEYTPETHPQYFI
jgi:hypothetical protein